MTIFQALSQELARELLEDTTGAKLSIWLTNSIPQFLDDRPKESKGPANLNRPDIEIEKEPHVLGRRTELLLKAGSAFANEVFDKGTEEEAEALQQMLMQQYTATHSWTRFTIRMWKNANLR